MYFAICKEHRRRSLNVCPTQLISAFVVCAYFREHNANHCVKKHLQYAVILKAVKLIIFIWKKDDIFLSFAQNIDPGYTLEPPRVPTLYVIEQKKNRIKVYPRKPQFYFIKVRCKVMLSG